MWLLPLLLAFPFLGYLIINFSYLLLGTQNLKQRYGAQWAVVTGASSGIGKAIATRLATQGINVVLVALGNDDLGTAHRDLTAAFPEREFRAVPCNLSDGTGAWMNDVIRATSDIPVQLLFNNAGYIVTGFFHHRPVTDHLANVHCNLTAAIHLTHHFYALMLEKKLRGAIVFTSSAAAVMPSPFAVGYGLTKAALTEMATSLAVEARAKGVDVCVFHPSPVNSRFLQGGGTNVAVAKLQMFDAAYALACHPDTLPDKIFAAIGRPCISVDFGAVAVGMRLMAMAVGPSLLAFGFALVAPFLPDYKKYSD
eukprot:TRINITY_DN6430_c0_g1_i1.p2 TRINITY_DN6430_c0_g1~~TRINITY_DN6430_c0_g1_i1.p2  ORF type:complete len:317 (+),score=130.08 TRINITY_DN6430_c0_g1_i1:23-952(+)